MNKSWRLMLLPENAAAVHTCMTKIANTGSLGTLDLSAAALVCAGVDVAARKKPKNDTARRGAEQTGGCSSPGEARGKM